MDYANAKIYRIEALSRPDLLPYYGATCSTLVKRFSYHRSKDCSSRELMECEDVSIVLVEAYPCHNKDELNAREAWWIRNNDCCNKKVPGRTKKEYDQLPEVKNNHNKRSKAYYQKLKIKQQEYFAKKALISGSSSDVQPSVSPSQYPQPPH